MPRTEPALAGLLLAAGGSKRLGKPKQFVSCDGVSLLRRAAGMMLASVDEVTVVSGALAEQVEAELQGLAVHIEHNDDWRAGMGGSIAKGMGAVSKGARGVLIMLCDQWKVMPADLQRLLDAWRQDPSKVVTAGWNGEFGPPVIFPARLFGDLEMLRGERGAKSLVDAQRQYTAVDMPNAKYDLDTPEDFETLCTTVEFGAQ